MIPAFIGFTCSASEGMVGFLTGSIPTPLLGFALLMYILGFRRFQPMRNHADKDTFYMNNFPCWVLTGIATVAMLAGIAIYAWAKGVF